jgi:hypothetical protein
VPPKAGRFFLFIRAFNQSTIQLNCIYLKTKLVATVRITAWFFLFCLVCLPLAAQKKNRLYQLRIKHASSVIEIDGIMDEAAWLEADSATNFFMVLPMDTSYGQVKTQVRMTYDNQNLYLIAVCYNERHGPYMVESLRRDFSFVKNDNFLLFMDPFDDQTNGFSFGANAAGAQWDGTKIKLGACAAAVSNGFISLYRHIGVG